MKIIIFSIMILCIYSCREIIENEEKKLDIPSTFYTKDYYYPIGELESGKVYEYVVVHEGDEYLSHYWHLQSSKDTSGNLFLNWERYNGMLQKDQYIKEWIINDGVIVEEYKFFVQDSATQEMKEYQNIVSQNVVFPFNASLDSVMAYRFICEMKLPPDFLTSKLIRDRKFAENSSFNYNDKEVDVIVFRNSDLYDIENKEEGGFWNVKKSVVEIYAKGIGLIYQEEKTDGIESSIVTQLKKVYSKDEFDKKIKIKKL
ncbi:MAG: hypothetical protein MK207_03825 [Saprospiraceae bacterium]|nr:hypothetical protein [Saprospiraceae bacterium]